MFSATLPEACFLFPRVWDVVFIHELLRMSSFYDLERDFHVCTPGPGPQRPKGQHRCSQQDRQCAGARAAFLVVVPDMWGFPVAQWSRTCLQETWVQFKTWVKKIPWRRKWQPTPVFLPGKSHGERSLAGYSPWGRKRV